MDIREKTIIVKGINQTENIKSLKYIEDTKKIEIVYNKSEQAYSYSCDNVQIEDNNVVGDTKIMLDYLHNISQYQEKEEMRNFLINTFDNFKYINPESVLYKYLFKLPIETKSVNHNFIFPFNFNLSQKSALEMALSNSISIINGPPGTGKTQTILNIIANLVAIEGKSVAVVSNNNEAVKNVQDKMKKQGYGFLTALLGNSENQEYFFEHMPIADVTKWNYDESYDELTHRISSLNDRLNTLMEQERKKVMLKQQLYEWELEKKHFEKYFENQQLDKIKQLPLLFKNPDKIIKFLVESSVARESNGLRKTVNNLIMIFKYWLFRYKNLQKCDIETVLCLQHEFYNRQVTVLHKEIYDIEQQLQRSSFNQILNEHKQYSEKLFKKIMYSRYNNLDKQEFTKKNFKEYFSQFMQIYPVILSTTFSLRNSVAENKLIDYVIIDESSQVDLCAAVLALSCSRNAIIVGDAKQLTQIVNPKIKEKLVTQMPSQEYDYFKHNILSSMIEVYGDEIQRTTLREHYRCHPNIIEFCNKKYYNGELIPYTKQDISDNPLILYRTAEGNHMRIVTKGKNKGNYNQREIDVVIEEVLKNPDVERENIGFVTPYRKQANKASEWLGNSIESDTVHKYQGREKDMMIMSTVLDKKSGYKNRMEFVDDPHLVNVAVSRAIKQLVLVTNHDLFFNDGENIHDLIRYMIYNTLDQNVIESEVVSIFDLLYKKCSDKLLSIKQRMNCNARYQSEEAIRVLLDDILSKSQYANKYTYTCQVLLRNLLNSLDLLMDEERNFVNNRSSVDFVIFRKIDKSCALIIEVDGFSSHENNPEQLYRDRLKDSILNKYHIPFLRLPTNGSSEQKKIEMALSEIE